MDARDVAIMTAIDLANACRIEMIDAGTHPPSVAVLAASMSQLHMSDRSEVPVCEIMLRSVSP